MSTELVLQNKCLFHITHIDNFPTILKKGLLSKNRIKSAKIKHLDISRDNIQHARAQILIPNTNHTLHDCVPAFFGARPPMLLAIRGKGIITQKRIIYILINWNILNESTTWFTDGNARSRETRFYQGTSNIDKVDLNIAGAYYWGNKGDDYKRRKQAEVLKRDNILVDDIVGFVVYNRDVRNALKRMLSAQNISKKIFVVPDYYY